MYENLVWCMSTWSSSEVQPPIIETLHERHGFSNRQHIDCLFNILFSRVTDHRCFPSQRASNAGSVSFHCLYNQCSQHKHFWRIFLFELQSYNNGTIFVESRMCRRQYDAHKYLSVFCDVIWSLRIETGSFVPFVFHKRYEWWMIEFLCSINIVVFWSPYAITVCDSNYFMMDIQYSWLTHWTLKVMVLTLKV